MYTQVIDALNGMSKNMRYKAIFLLMLRTDGYLTSKQMGELLNVTDRTVKNDIKNLREELQIFSNYLKIESKPSLGYALIIDDIEIKNELKKYYRIYQPQIVDTELGVCQVSCRI